MSITLLENFRAVFYTPFYAAFSLGAFEEQGVEVRLETSPDPAQNAKPAHVRRRPGELGRSHARHGGL